MLYQKDITKSVKLGNGHVLRAAPIAELFVVSYHYQKSCVWKWHETCVQVASDFKSFIGYPNILIEFISGQEKNIVCFL